MVVSKLRVVDLGETGHKPPWRRRRLINLRRDDDASAPPSCP
jgi:hypothetical protein